MNNQIAFADLIPGASPAICAATMDKCIHGEDALSLANRSDFGLGGSVWSGDAARAKGLAERTQSGTVWVNQHLDFGPEVPLAGAKQSGIGVDWTELGLAEFSQVNVINQAA